MTQKGFFARGGMPARGLGKIEVTVSVGGGSVLTTEGYYCR